jgi:hypothetical protein
MSMRHPRRPCPIKGCEKRISHDYLVCPEHWRLVPRPLQNEVYAAYDRYLESDRSHVAADKLREVQSRAIDEIYQQLAPQVTPERT